MPRDSWLLCVDRDSAEAHRLKLVPPRYPDLGLPRHSAAPPQGGLQPAERSLKAVPWSFYILGGTRSANVARTLVSAAPRLVSALRSPALDQQKSSARWTSPALTGLFSIYAAILSRSFSSLTQWSYDSACQNVSPVRPRTRFASRAVAPLRDCNSLDGEIFGNSSTCT